MIIKVKKLDPSATIPSIMTDGAAAVDLTATSRTRTRHSSGCITATYGTGLSVEIPAGFVGLLFPRSSVYKTGLSMVNSVGVIDSDYRGEIKVMFYDTHSSEGLYNIGDRVAQLMIVPIPSVQFEEVEELTETGRGTGGFGSTGK